MAQFFEPQMPVDRLIGATSEALRQHPQAMRSSHPILSFTGVNAQEILASQRLAEPLAPIRLLCECHAWVLLLGVDHMVNTSLHYAELLAGRKQFIRWALTPQGVVECPGFPGCSDGFESASPYFAPHTRRVQVGMASIQAIPLIKLIHVAKRLIEADPLALLCERSYCERCAAVREWVEKNSRSKRKLISSG
jgi:aminoglycoside 3-N-acetyltransferase